MSKRKKIVTPRAEPRMWRVNQNAVKHDIKPKKHDRNACRNNKGRRSREDW